MVVPCWMLIRHAALKAGCHASVRVRHAIRHLHHACVTHPEIWVQTACHVAPNALVIGMLAFVPPAADERALLPVPPSTIIVDPVPSDIDPTAFRFGLPDLKFIDPAVGPAPPSTITGWLGAAEADPPDASSDLRMDPGLLAALASDPSTDARVQPQPVPEPSSLLLLTAAICGLSLLSRAAKL